MNAFNSGLALLPMTVAIMILMVGFIGKLVGKFGFKKNLIIGLILLLISLIWFAQIPADGNFLDNVLWPSLLAAAGMSLAYVPGTIASMSGAKPEETGLASGLVNTSYQIGSALGLAIAVAIFNAVFNSVSGTNITNVEILNQGFHAAFYGAAGFMLIAILIAIFKIK